MIQELPPGAARSSGTKEIRKKRKKSFDLKRISDIVSLLDEACIVCKQSCRKP